MAIAQRQAPDRLVGRLHEVAELDRAIDRVVSGSPYVVELVGESGIGKSRLLSELGRRAAKRGFLVLDGRAAEFERDVPFGLIVDALNDYVGGLEPSVLRALDEDSQAELASILPSLSALAGARAPGPRPDAERYRVHYAIRALLERLVKRQPVLLALDDAHWADPASFEVIGHLLRRFRGRLLGAVAFRIAPKRLEAALESVARLGSAIRLELQPLSEEEALQLIDPSLDAATRAMLFRESGGNPFYLEQLARARRPRGGATVSSTRLPAGVALPAAVFAALEGELDSLTPECRVVLDAAAVAGESFEPDLVAAVAQCDETSTLTTLDELLRLDLMRPTGAPRRFRFRHPIVRRAVYDAMPGAWRVGAHRRAADALAAANAPAGELAHHVERSASVGDEQAIALLAGAAREAAQRAPATSGRWMLAAVDLLPLDADRQRRAGLLGEAASALISAGAYEDSLLSLGEALALASPEKVEARAELIARLAYARRRSGGPFDSRVALEQALGSLAEADGAAGISVQLELAIDRLWHDDFGLIHELTAHLLTIAREREELWMISLAAALSSLAKSSERQVEEARVDLAEAGRAYLALPDERLAERIYISYYVSLATVRLEQSDEALAQIKRGLELARATGQAATVIPWPSIAAYALLFKGRAGEAATSAARAIDADGLSRNDWRTVWALEADALCAYWAGDTQRALGSAREMVRRSEREHRFLSGPARIQLAAALQAAGDEDGAAAELLPLDAEPTWRLFDLNAAHGWDLLVGTQIARGELSSAAAAAARAVGRAKAAGLPCQLSTALFCEAAASLANGDHDAASRSALQAREVADDAGNPLLSARAQALHGRALAAAGESAKALAELEQAERTLSKCGAVREADSAAQELRLRGVRVRRARARRGTGLAALTQRESEIAEHVATGKSNREIAAALFLSEKTIESHLVRAYAKLGVHSRTALTAIVVREGRESTPDA